MQSISHGPDCNCAECAAHVAAYQKKLAKRKGKKRIVREDDVEGKYVEATEQDGGLCLKVKVLGRPGYPDRLVLRSIEHAARFYTDEKYGKDVPISEPDREFVACIVARAVHFAELKKDATSRFQPKQKTIIPMLRKRGFKVDLPHG